MADYKDKIAKLLALAGNNSSPEEAKAALLKARKLMAEHKLRPEGGDGECCTEPGRDFRNRSKVCLGGITFCNYCKTLLLHFVPAARERETDPGNWFYRVGG